MNQSNLLGIPQNTPSEVFVWGGNGYGSAGTTIKRFLNIATNTGPRLTYKDSATLGASVTINADGLYFLQVSLSATSAGFAYGITVNATDLTATPQGLLPPTLLAIADNPLSNSGYNIPVQCITYLKRGDVVRPQFESGASEVTAELRQWFRVVAL